MAQLRKQPKFNLKFNSKVKKVTRLVGKVAATFFSSEKNQENTVLGKVSSQSFINSTWNTEADSNCFSVWYFAPLLNLFSERLFYFLLIIFLWAWSVLATSFLMLPIYDFLKMSVFEPRELTVTSIHATNLATHPSKLRCPSI